MKKSIFKRHLPSILLSLFMAAIFMLFFGECNTPLGARIGSDNAMYLTIGAALVNGYAPYSDVFDHKGPLLFLLQMLPQWFAGGYSTFAVYVQEVLFLFASLRILCAIASHLHMKKDWLIQLIYLACLGPFLDGGNLTEEYSCLFILAGLYTVLHTFDGKDVFCKPSKMLILPAAMLGGFTMLAFMTRANNALGLCGLTLGLALYMLFTHHYSHLGHCILGYIGGMVISALPILFWLASHGALKDAFYGSILHNMMYAETGSTSRIETLFFSSYGRKAIMLAALSCLGAIAAYINSKNALLPLGMFFATLMAGFSCFISHKFYIHYLMVLVPFAAFGAAHVFSFIASSCHRIIKLTGFAFGILMIILLVSFGAKANRTRISELNNQGDFEQQAKALYELVPETDRERFMAYRVEPKWYVYTKSLPCMRFYFLQEILADADPAVMDEIVDEFENNPPKWLVIYYNRPFYPPYDARVAEIFETQYEFVDAKGDYQLLRLIASEPS